MTDMHSFTKSLPLTGNCSALDYAYGYNGCWLLTRGAYNRNCLPPRLRRRLLCPDPANPGQEGVCSPDRALYNADSYSFVASGIWFTYKLGKPVDLPPGPPVSITGRKRVIGCPEDDILAVDA